MNELIFKQPKSFEGTRISKVPTNVANYLEKTKKERNAKDSENIHNITPKQPTDKFIYLRKKVSINCRFHNLRHYYASVLLALEIPYLYSMKLMGHSSTVMLKKVYQHLMEYKINESINKIDNFFEDKYFI